jgi:hypothetical protein
MVIVGVDQHGLTRSKQQQLLLLLSMRFLIKGHSWYKQA